jgi:hypothetical protein
MLGTRTADGILVFPSLTDPVLKPLLRYIAGGDGGGVREEASNRKRKTAATVPEGGGGCGDHAQ